MLRLCIQREEEQNADEIKWTTKKKRKDLCKYKKGFDSNGKLPH